jgi:Dolichyl-phosphate-mannose-protein mannosyltransferase
MTSQPSRNGTSWHLNAFLVFLALFLGSVLLTWGMAYSTRWDATPSQLDVDETEYYDMAGEILQGRYEFHPRRVVGHLLALALMRGTLGDRIFPIQLAMSLVFSFTAPLIYLLARRELGSQRVALLAGLSVMTWPIYVKYGATIYSEALALPVFAATLLSFPGPQYQASSQAKRWLGAGLMLGLCMHIRPMYLLYSPFAALFAYWRGRGGRGGIISAGLVALGCLTAVLPWSIFLSAREGSFMLLCSAGGETIAGGLNPELIRKDQDSEEANRIVAPDGRFTWVGPGKWLPPGKTGFLSQEETELPYTVQSNLLASRTKAWVLKNPGAALYLTLRKLTYLWGIYPFWNGRSQTLLGNIPTIGLLILSSISLIRLRRYFRELSLFWTLPLFVTIAALISWGSWRFRQPGDLGLIVLAAALPWMQEVKEFLARVSLGSGEDPIRVGQQSDK